MFFYFFAVFLFLLNCFICNVIFWWSVFFLMTLVFVFLNFNNSYSSINYFIFQEFLGLLFVFFSFSLFQFFIILLKVGVSPLHFWSLSIFNGLNGFSAFWFLTFQKLPYFPIFSFIFDFGFFLFLVFGIIFCYFNLFFCKSFKGMVFVSSVESFNWLLISLFSSIFSGFFLFFYYIFVMFFLLDYSSSKGYDFYNWELVFLFMNFPMTITFFIKVFSIIFFLNLSSFYLLFVLFFMVFSVFGFGFWFFNVGLKFNFYGFYNFAFFYFIFFPVMFFCLF
uniref:NADH dehydrogenase subunit 2 n=1 Tax=Strongyloides sp. EN-2020a TaxID=2725239 RepID=A0A6J4CUF3_9BILA|nr:NADH dehydrogenase subunit 2 [Strongyloides sp. EN-2020a]